MSGRLTRWSAVGVVCGGLVAGVVPPVAAQGTPVGGSGNRYFIAGAANTSGRAVVDFVYGDPGDEIYVGDFVNQNGFFGDDGRDDVMVRRGNVFHIRGVRDGRRVVFGSIGDQVLVGDWDGDGSDGLGVRRGNQFFITNDLARQTTDAQFTYGDPGDQILVGNWDQVKMDFSDQSTFSKATDTLMVRRGNHYFVRNQLSSGRADHDFVFGDPGDQVMVGDWATPPVRGDNPATTAVETDWLIAYPENGDGSDQLAVRRGNVYLESSEVWRSAVDRGAGLSTEASYAYGDPTDTAFTARWYVDYDANGTRLTIIGDGLGVRR